MGDAGGDKKKEVGNGRGGDEGVGRGRGIKGNSGRGLKYPTIQ